MWGNECASKQYSLPTVPKTAHFSVNQHLGNKQGSDTVFGFQKTFCYSTEQSITKKTISGDRMDKSISPS